MLLTATGDPGTGDSKGAGMYIYAPRSGPDFRVTIEREKAKVILKLQRLLPDEVLKDLKKTVGANARRINEQSRDFSYQIVFTLRKNSDLTLIELRRRLQAAMPAIIEALPPLVVAARVRLDTKLNTEALKLAEITIGLVGSCEFTKRDGIYTILWRGFDDESPAQIAERLQEAFERLPYSFTCVPSTEDGVPSYLIKPPSPEPLI